MLPYSTMRIDPTEFLEGDDEPSLATVQLAERTVSASVLFKQWQPTISIPAQKQPSAPDRPTVDSFELAQERFYLPSELAEQWKVSVETVRVLFRNEQGVLKIGKPGTKFRRPYYMLRIPESVVERVRNRLSE